MVEVVGVGVAVKVEVEVQDVYEVYQDMKETNEVVLDVVVQTATMLCHGKCAATCYAQDNLRPPESRARAAESAMPEPYVLACRAL